MQRPFPWKCRKCRERQVNLVTVDYSTDLEHDGRVYTVTVKGLSVLKCGECNAETLPDESYNALMDELRAKAGLLSPSEIAQKRSALSLNQKDFAKLLNVAPETVSRWETGAQIQQRVMNSLMRGIFDDRNVRAYFRWLHGLPPEPLPARAKRATPVPTEIAPSPVQGEVTIGGSNVTTQEGRIAGGTLTIDTPAFNILGHTMIAAGLGGGGLIIVDK